jgi:hypothetical protein
MILTTFRTTRRGMSAMNFFCKISGAMPKAVSISAVAAHGHFNLDPKTQSYRFTSKSKRRSLCHF